MKFVLVLAMAVGATASFIPITSFTRDLRFTPDPSSDSTSYITANGISQSHNVQVVRVPGAFLDEFGRLIRTEESLVMNGHSFYTSPEGQQIRLTWTAGPEGFQPQGDHLPRSVELPADHKEIWRLATGTPLQIA